MGLYLGGLIIGGIFESEILGAYFREGLFWGRLIRILWFVHVSKDCILGILSVNKI